VKDYLDLFRFDIFIARRLGD